MGNPAIWPSGDVHRLGHLRGVLIGAWIVFALRIRKLVRLMRLGRPENRFDHLGDRIKYFTLMVLGQRGVLRDPLPGIAHFFTFWGFIIIQLDALNLWARACASRCRSSLAASSPRCSTSSSPPPSVALLLFAFRRLVLRPKQLQSQSHSPADAFIILGLIMLVLVTLFFFEIFAYVATGGEALDALRRAGRRRMAGHPGQHRFGASERRLVGKRADRAGLPDLHPALEAPAPAGDAVQRLLPQLRPKGALQIIANLEEREDYGVHKISQFTWKQLLDGYACTECGRCNSVCPALATDKPLWPKEIILGVKEELFATGDMHAGQARSRPRKRARTEPMVGGLITRRDAVGLHQLRRVHGDLPGLHRACAEDRRHAPLPGDGGEPLPAGGDAALQQPGAQPEPLGDQQRHARRVGAGASSVPTLAEDPDVDVLYWVGCMGSFDARNQKVATAFAKVMQHGKRPLRHPWSRGGLHRRPGAAHRQRVSVADAGAAEHRDAERLRLQQGPAEAPTAATNAHAPMVRPHGDASSRAWACSRAAPTTSRRWWRPARTASTPSRTSIRSLAATTR